MSTLVTGGGDLRLAAGTGTVQISAPTDTSPTGQALVLTLPQTIGSANQVLKNSGTAGTLEFGSAPTLTTTSADVSVSGSSSTTITGISADAKKVVMHWRDVSHGTQGELIGIQIGTSGSLDTTATYGTQDFFNNNSGSEGVNGSVNTQNLWLLGAWTNPANIFFGCLTIELLSSNTYYMSGSLFTSAHPDHFIYFSGTKVLSGALGQVKLLTNLGNNFDGGTVNITQYF